ncbi:hypothetical protein G6011_03817 [Alternaria panax]|uniref:Rhodopsin domain-containing protein n=1 Tax=Alternaria panax TaxID=48097 RepID=A0AAD4IFD9_9PLEO|nr:hypothetical protein G6011_03817 [Alternaria panax]
MSAVLEGADPQTGPIENEGTTILASTLAIATIATIITVARLYVRVKMIRNVGWDDYAMFLTMIMCIVGQVIIVPQVSHGAGRHIADVEQEDYKTVLKLNFVTQPLFLIAICFLKLSVGFFLLRMIPMLWRAHMNRRHKASLICILGLGTFATTAALVKLSYMPNYGRDGDLMWDSRNLTIWTVAECNVGIIAANLSCLKPLVQRMLISTYGKGSRKASQPRANTYAQGTKHCSMIKGCGPVGSDRASEGEFLGYGPAYKSYLLNTINAAKDKTGQHITEISSGRSSPAAGRSSHESETMLDNKTLTSLRDHNLTVTTHVDVTESLPSQEGYESVKTHDGSQAKEMI